MTIRFIVQRHINLLKPWFYHDFCHPALSPGTGKNKRQNPLYLNLFSEGLHPPLQYIAPTELIYTTITSFPPYL